MKKNLYLYPSLLLLFTLSINSFSQDNSTDIQELTILYDQFEETVKNKEREEHLSLYLHNGAHVNIVDLSPSGPSTSFSSVESWVSGWPPDPVTMQLIITNDEYYIINSNLAYSIANFDQQINESSQGAGIDLFLYIKTNNGWKFTTLNNTGISQANRNRDVYTFEIEIEVSTIIDSLINTIHEKNAPAFAGLFRVSTASFFAINDRFSTEYDLNAHTAAAFAEKLSTHNYLMQIEGINIRIVDKYMAVAHANYRLFDDGAEIEKGQQIWTLVGSRFSGWKITSLIRTIGEFAEITDVEENTQLPEDYILSQNYPNPFNPSTIISYKLPSSAITQLKVYDILGKEVATLVDEFQSAGNYNINLDVGATQELSLPSGVYFYRLISGSFAETKKMVLLK